MKSTYRFALALGALAICLTVAPQASLAQWDNGTGNQQWDDPNNWAPGAFPAGANALVNLDGANAAIIDNTPASGIVDIFVGQGGGNVGQIDHSAGVAGTGAGNWGFIGDIGGTGTYNLADPNGVSGTFTGMGTGSGDFSAGRLYVGIGGGSDGTLNVNTTGTLTSTNTGESFVIAAGGATGVTNLDNGTIDTPGEFQIGRSGNGTLNMSGGVAQSAEWFVVGRDGGSVGTLNMTGGTINAAQSLGFLVVGSFGGATGTANVSGGTINAGTDGAYIGEGGNGTLNLSGSAILNTSALRVGLNDGAVGLLDIDGSGVNVSASDISLGLSSNPDPNVNDTTAVGTLNFTADLAGISTILASGDVNLSSADGDFLTVDLSSLTPGAGLHSDIQLIDGATRQGIFTGLGQGAVGATDGSGNSYYVDYLSTPGDVWLRTVPTAVPEPATLLLAGLSGLWIAARRRR